MFNKSGWGIPNQGLKIPNLAISFRPGNIKVGYGWWIIGSLWFGGGAGAGAGAGITTQDNWEVPGAGVVRGGVSQ